jgi:hypothetical protein
MLFFPSLSSQRTRSFNANFMLHNGNPFDKTKSQVVHILCYTMATPLIKQKGK